MKRAEAEVPVLTDAIGRRPAVERRRRRRTDTEGPAMSEADIDQLLSGALVDVLMLSRDEALAAEIRAAVGHSREIAQSDDPKRTLSLLTHGRYGVLVLDHAALGRDVQSFIARLKREAPAVVILLVCTREDGNSLMELVTDGQIFRLVLRPISPGQTRRGIDTAIEWHRELKQQHPRTAGSRDATAPARGRGLPLIGAGLACLTVAAFWWLRSSEPPAVAVKPVAAPTATVEPPDAVPASAPSLTEFERRLADGEKALAEGRLFRPQGDNAHDHFTAALALEPASAAAAAGWTRLVDSALAQFELELAQGRLAAAALTLDRLSVLAPDHPALTPLRSRLQLAQRRERLAQALQTAAGGELGPLLALLEPGVRIEPGENLDAAVELLLERIRLAVAHGRPGEARTIANALRRADLEHPQLAEIDSVLASAAGPPRTAAPAPASQPAPAPSESRAREQAKVVEAPPAAARPPTAAAKAPERAVQVATAGTGTTATQPGETLDRLLAGLLSSLDQDRLLEPADDSAAWYLAQIRASAPEHPGWQQGARAFAGKLVQHAEAALADGDYDAAEGWLGHAAALGIETPSITTTRSSIEQQRIAVESSKVIPATSLELVHYEPPVYPSLAVRRNVEGWVDVVFTVTSEGTTRDVSVVGAERPGYFEDASVAAVSKWRFKPRVFRGRSIDQRVSARVRFDYK